MMTKLIPLKDQYHVINMMAVMLGCIVCVMGLVLQGSFDSDGLGSITSLPIPLSIPFVALETTKPRTTQGELSDLEWEMERARLVQMSADRTRESFLKREPDVYEAGITPLERLWRLLILTLKPTATNEQMKWVARWEQWRYANAMKMNFDTRNVTDRFLAYTSYRRLGLIPDEPEYVQFEADFDTEFKNSGEYLEAQTGQ